MATLSELTKRLSRIEQARRPRWDAHLTGKLTPLPTAQAREVMKILAASGAFGPADEERNTEDGQAQER